MNNNALNPAMIQLWLNDNFSQKAVEESLISKGYAHSLIDEYIKEFKRLKDARKQITGFVLMGIGGFLGFIACVMAILNIVPDFQDFFLFGVTIVGISIVLYGMYLAFQ
jgi:hypothetical protein